MDKYMDPQSTGYFDYDTAEIKEEKTDFDSISDSTNSIPQPLIINKPNTVAANNWEIDKMDIGCYFKTTIKIEENQDFSVIKNEYTDTPSTSFFESNYDTAEIKVEKTEYDSISDSTNLIPESLSINFVGSKVNTTIIKNKDSTSRKHNTVAFKQEFDETNNVCCFDSEIEFEENKDLIDIKEEYEPNSTNYFESNYDTAEIKEEKTELDSIADSTNSIPQPLSIKSEIEIEENKDLAGIKEEDEPNSTNNTNCIIKNNQTQTEENPSISIGKEWITQYEKPCQRHLMPFAESKHLDDLKTFSESETLNKKKTTKTKGRTFQCEICKKTFSQSGSLKYHMMTHTGERPFQCEICKKAFSQSGTLKVHKITHTGERPYQCEICKKAYSRSGDLKKHIMTHSGERPFRCEICKKAFSRSEHLKNHKMTHTGDRPFQCDTCKKTFAQSGDLKKHKRTHTGERPFQCEICKKAFSLSGDLKNHKMTHTGDRPYQCDICKKTFAQSGYLIKHKRTHGREAFAM